MKVAFDVIIPPVPGTFPWSDYSYVICGRLRRRILQGVQRLNPGNTGDGVDVRNLKRWMADSLPVSANALARVLHELLHRGLVRREARRKTRAFSYWLTETGQEIVTQLDR